MGKKQEVLMWIVFCVALYIIGIFVTRKESRAVKSRIMKNIFSIYFILYVVLLLKYTMFDSHFGREFGLWIHRANLKEAYSNYFASRTNFEPFKMINAYWRSFANGNLPLRIFLINILGNIVAFIPLAMFLPIFFKWAKKFWSFALGIFIIAIMIECFQIILMTGAFDVDDIILNVSGALIAYMICHIKPIKKILNDLTGKNY